MGKTKIPFLVLIVCLSVVCLSCPDAPPRPSVAAAPVIFYSDFGAKGNGVTDDFEAIIAAHEAANQKGMKVRANADAQYYIGPTTKTARIETDTDWSGAVFIIDDRNIPRTGNTWHDSRLFEIASTRRPESIETAAVASLEKNQAVLNLGLEYDALIEAVDSHIKRYIRSGTSENQGQNQTDVFIVRKNGSIDPAAPIIWDYPEVTSMTAYPIDEETLTVKGGTFITIANTGTADNGYMKRGIYVTRSNTVIDGLVHRITSEGTHGGPYEGIILVNCCVDVTIKNATFTGHKAYANTSGTTIGTYDMQAGRTINLSVINSGQTNDIKDSAYWGVFASSYSKNIVFDNVRLSRFDAHQGVYNAAILNSELGHQRISVIGSGLLRIENTKVFANAFIYFRDDYGSTWEGEVLIRNCTLTPLSNWSNIQIIHTNNNGKWNFGYPCYMPETITIDGLVIDETNAPPDYSGVYLVYGVSPGSPLVSPYTLTETIYLSGFTSGQQYRMSNNYIRDNIEVIVQ